MTPTEVRSCVNRLRLPSYLGLICLAILLAHSTELLAQEKTQCALPDCDQAKAFFEKFQAAVNADQRQEAASLVRYPLRSYRNGKATVVQNKTQFLSKYDAIFDATTRCALKAASVDDVWGNWRGFTLGAGLIWWDRIIPDAAGNANVSDLTKYPFGVFSVNHSPEVAEGCGGAKAQ